MAHLVKLPPMKKPRRGWGTVGVGNWAPNRIPYPLKGYRRQPLLKDEPGTQVVGVCANCGRNRAAFNLELKLKPFARKGEETWVCKGGCE